jgi:hypothetical protein
MMTPRPYRYFLTWCVALLCSAMAGAAWAQNAESLGIKPYQASPEFPVKPSSGLAAPTGQDIQQGYQPSVPAPNGQVSPDESATAIDPNTGETVTAVPQVTEDPKLQAQFKEVFAKKAVIFVTDKISANTKTLTLDVPSKVEVYDLTIQVEKCYISGDGADPEHAVLLEVYGKPSETSTSDNERLFAGWMFKKRPSLTSLQSAYYDVTLTKCISDTPREAVTLERVAPAGNPSQQPSDAQADDAATQDAPETAPPAAESANEAASPVPAPVAPEHGDAAKQEADKAVDAVTKILGGSPDHAQQDHPSQD